MYIYMYSFFFSFHKIKISTPRLLRPIAHSLSNGYCLSSPSPVCSAVQWSLKHPVPFFTLVIPGLKFPFVQIPG